jgi:hypothetical protein
MPLSAPLRILAGAIAAIAWAALALQLTLILRRVDARGLPAVDGIVVFLVFFTTQINILAAAVTTCAAAGLPWLSKRDGFKAALAAYMLAGSLIFALWLRPYYRHGGLQLLADVLLHYVTPPLYILFWLLAVPKAALAWDAPWRWLIYPALYIVGALLFGMATGFYPYPIVNLHRLDVWLVAANVVGLGVAIVAAGFIVVAAMRRLARR